MTTRRAPPYHNFFARWLAFIVRGSWKADLPAQRPSILTELLTSAKTNHYKLMRLTLVPNVSSKRGRSVNVAIGS